MKIGDFITGVAVVAFLLGLCSIESLKAVPLITMFVSGAWIVCYGYFSEEEKRERDGR